MSGDQNPPVTFHSTDWFIVILISTAYDIIAKVDDHPLTIRNTMGVWTLEHVSFLQGHLLESLYNWVGNFIKTTHQTVIRF